VRGGLATAQAERIVGRNPHVRSLLDLLAAANELFKDEHPSMSLSFGGEDADVR
jgi:hypothetical protein